MIGAPRKILLTVAAVLMALTSNARCATAERDVSVADLQAAARALGFLDSLPRDGTIVVGIVYAPRSSESKARAGQIAVWLNTFPGPNKSVFRTKIISIADLAQSGDRLDAIFLLPGLAGDAAQIVDVTRRRHLVSISNDPACLEANFCVLMVRADPSVEIVLHTAMAEAVGASFSSVFTMMVKRK